MNRQYRDLTGQTFGLLTAETMVGTRKVRGKARAFWRCRCVCGVEVEVIGYHLTDERRKYCDRMKHRDQWLRDADLALPQHAHPLTWRSWVSMIWRCKNGNPNYGGRGIKVCEAWAADFMAFLADVGPRPSRAHTIERLDVNGNYEPGNCVWATRDVQDANRRDTVWVEYQGEQRKLIDLSREHGLSSSQLRGRLRIGWDIERAISHPVARHAVGAPRKFSRGEIAKMMRAGKSVPEVMKRTGASQATCYRVARLAKQRGV